MTDTTRDGYDDEDRLPWLEAVEDEEQGPSPLKLILAVLLGLAVISAVVYGLYWLGTRGGDGGNGEIIASPGDYKVRPDQPGGMQVDNQSATQIATSEGTEINASIDRRAAPEAPAVQGNGQAGRTDGQAQPRPAPPPQAQPQPAPQPAPAPAPRPQPRPAGPTIQVGAFPSEAIANQQWQRLTQRFPYVRGLQQSVTVFQNAGRTYYRLRASGAEASAICRRLRAAGQPCFDVN